MFINFSEFVDLRVRTVGRNVTVAKDTQCLSHRLVSETKKYSKTVSVGIPVTCRNSFKTSLQKLDWDCSFIPVSVYTKKFPLSSVRCILPGFLQPACWSARNKQIASYSVATLPIRGGSSIRNAMLQHHNSPPPPQEIIEKLIIWIKGLVMNTNLH